MRLFDDLSKEIIYPLIRYFELIRISSHVVEFFLMNLPRVNKHDNRIDSVGTRSVS